MSSYSMNCNCKQNPRPRNQMPVYSSPKDDCGCQSEQRMSEMPPRPYPEGPSLALASVKWQKWKNVMDAGSALQHGSIFEDLVLPFVGAKAACSRCAQPSYQGRDRR